MILVVGGTGKIGRAIVSQLLSEGKSVRILVRYSSAYHDIKVEGAEVIFGDLKNPSSVEKACNGCEVIISSVHGLGKGRRDSPELVDRMGQIKLIDVAKKQNIKHFILISIIRTPWNDEVQFFQIKKEVEDYLIGSGLPFTILRIGPLYERLWELWGDSIMKNRVIFIPKGSKRISPVATQDIALTISIILNRPETINEIFNLQGPEVFTGLDLISRVRVITRKNFKVIEVPILFLKTLRFILKLLNSNKAHVLDTLIFASKHDFYVENNLAKEFGVKLTSLEEFYKEKTEIERLSKL